MLAARHRRASRRREGCRGFHTFSIGVWLVWLVPYFVGMLIGIPAFHVSDLVALAAAAGVVAVLALALLLTSKRSHA